MTTAILIAVKDLRQRVRDSTVIVVAFLLPFITAGILGLTLPNVSNVSHSELKLGVVNLDNGPTALYFIKEVLEPLQRRKLIKLRSVSLKTGRRLVSDGKLTAVITLPPGFSKAGRSEAPTHFEIIGDGQLFKQVGTYVARSIASSFANQLNGVRLAVLSTRKKHAAGGETVSLSEHASEIPKQFKINDLNLPSKELDIKTREAAGLTIFFLFLTAQLGFASIIDERNHGTLTRLLVASVSRRSIIFGKLLTSIVLGLASTLTLAAATTLVLGAHWGHITGVALLVFVCVLAATALTACIASFAQTSEQAVQWQAISAAILGAVGGAVFPVAQAGGLLATLSILTPHAQFLRGLGLLAHGGGLATVLPMVGAILAFTAVFGGIAALRVQHLTRV
jgi:linearmycin/streptolysin S transport system permease protein